MLSATQPEPIKDDSSTLTLLRVQAMAEKFPYRSIPDAEDTGSKVIKNSKKSHDLQDSSDSEMEEKFRNQPKRKSENSFTYRETSVTSFKRRQMLSKRSQEKPSLMPTVKYF